MFEIEQTQTVQRLLCRSRTGRNATTSACGVPIRAKVKVRAQVCRYSRIRLCETVLAAMKPSATRTVVRWRISEKASSQRSARSARRSQQPLAQEATHRGVFGEAERALEGALHTDRVTLELGEARAGYPIGLIALHVVGR